MSQPSQAGAAPALISGPEFSLMPDAAPTLIGNIALRAAEQASHVMRSVQTDGTVREQTVDEAWQRAGAIAVRFESEGIGAGRQIVLLQRDTLEYVPAFWACLRAGATAVPLSGVAAASPKAELADVLGRLDRPAILSDGPSPLLDRVTALLPDVPVLGIDEMSASGEPGAHDEASIPCLVPTSGSTGRVKLVAFETNAWLYRMCSRNYSGLGRDADCLGVFPFDSLNGYRAVFLNYASWTQLPSRVLMSRPSMVLEAVDRFKATSFQTTNTMAASLARLEASATHRLDLSSLNQVGLGGEAVTRASAIALRDLLVGRGAPSNVVAAGYGTTETGVLLVGADPTTAPLDDSGAIQLGGCIAGTTIRIVDDHGHLLSEGEVGHVEVSAPCMMFSNYWGEPEATRDSFTSDGWWKTGDVGTVSDGSFSFRGRAKQTLVIGARKFSLTDIDAHLQADRKVARRTISYMLRQDDSVTDSLGVVFLLEEGETCGDNEDVREAIRASLVRRYGFAPAATQALPAVDVPLTASGKVDRAALATHMKTRPMPRAGEMVTPSTAREAMLAMLWREALDLDGHFDRDTTFEQFGGDSLRLATLLSGVDAKLGAHVDLQQFVAMPTFDTLVRLAACAVPEPDFETDETPWPLPARIRRGILSFIEPWKGERVTPDRLLLGLNLTGSRPPIFCVVNAAHEFYNLSEALGIDQPLFAFRSAHEVGSHDEELIQKIALRYVQDIQEVARSGPVFLLGQCQGGTIALAVAQHMLRRRRHVPLLALADWYPAEEIFYPDAVVLFYGQDGAMNPTHPDIDFAPEWRRRFLDYEIVEVAGSYGHLYDKNNVTSLANQLATRCTKALERAPHIPPETGYAIEVAARIPEILWSGERRLLALSITNAGSVAISSVSSGLLLGGYWIRDDAPVPRAGASDQIPLSDIKPGQTIKAWLEIAAPVEAGYHALMFDLVADGNKWLSASGGDRWPARIFVPRNHIEKAGEFLRSGVKWIKGLRHAR